MRDEQPGLTVEADGPLVRVAGQVRIPGLAAATLPDTHLVRSSHYHPENPGFRITYGLGCSSGLSFIVATGGADRETRQL
jgi:hypothetical protein